MNAEMEKILDRVRKMLRLANDPAAAEGERDNAMRMAHATLAKYNLTLAQVETTTEDKRVFAATTTSDFPWMRNTAAAVGRLFFCEYFYMRIKGTGKVSHNFVGKEGNAIVAQEMAMYVIRSITKEAKQRAKSRPDAGSWWRDFSKGAAARIIERCADLQYAAEKASKAEATPGTALVLASVYRTELDANAAFLKKKLGFELKSSKNRQKRPGTAAFMEGAEFGSSINLGRQLR